MPLRALASRCLVAGLLALAPLGLVGSRGCGGLSVRIDAPTDGALVDEPSLPASATVGSGHTLASIEVRVDGVRLVEALGLTPPFENQGGVVVIGSDLWTLSGFTIQALPGGTHLVEVDLDGVPLGAHALAVSAMRAGGIVETASAGFERVAGFTLEARVLDAGGRPDRPKGFPTLLFGASLGQPLAGAVGLSGGGALRQGFVEAAEARLAGEDP